MRRRYLGVIFSFVRVLIKSVASMPVSAMMPSLV